MSQNRAELRAGRDAYVNHDKPDTAYANTTRLAVRADGSGSGRFSYIYFPVSLPKGVTVTNATLRMTMATDTTGAGNRTITVKRVSEPWTASKTTWANKPGVTGAGVAVTKSGKPEFTDWEWNVTSHVQAVVNGADWFGWRIESDENTNRLFSSSQADGNKPLLVIEWAEQPYAPQDLNPSGGGYVSTGSPALSFDYRDNRGTTAMGGFQVQIASNAGMTSMIHDSGTVNSAVPIYDLATVGSWSALTTDAPVYWRVRVKDAANNWSNYSDVTSFKYDAKGTLAILSPAGTTITDPSPTVVWSLTGKTQAAWQVIVRSERGAELYDSGKYTSSLNSWEIPAKYNGQPVIAEKTKTYDIIVRAWDDVDRAAVIGHDVAYEAVRSVTYSPATSGPVVAPSTPVATDMASAGEPGIGLTWTRSEAPDRFDIWRGSQKLDSVDPGDVLTETAGTYAYTDFSARSGKTYQYRISASVNGESRESGVATITKDDYAFVGIWLIDPRRNIKVQLLGDDSGSWDMGEESQTYTPIGATRPRLVTQALRGYEGSITGMLAGSETKTIEEQEADMFALKETPGQQYALVLADMAIPVVVSNIVVAPTPHKEKVRMVSFNFWQQGNLSFEAEI